MGFLKTLFRYDPSSDKETRVTWELDDVTVELYHEESDSYFFLSVEEIPKLVEALKDIYIKSKVG